MMLGLPPTVNCPLPTELVGRWLLAVSCLLSRFPPSTSRILRFSRSSLTAEASASVLPTFFVTRILSFGTPSLTALSFRISPSGLLSGLQGTWPPVKISKGALRTWKSSIPPSNRSTASDHSPSRASSLSRNIPLNTTIASAFCTLSTSRLPPAPSTSAMIFPLTNPVLKR